MDCTASVDLFLARVSSASINQSSCALITRLRTRSEVDTAARQAILSGGRLRVSAGGAASGDVVSDGGQEFVSSGGTASGTVVLVNGIGYVYEGGLISGAVGLGIFVMLGNQEKLAMMLGGNFLLAGMLGVVLFLLLHHHGFAQWVKQETSPATIAPFPLHMLLQPCSIGWSYGPQRKWFPLHVGRYFQAEELKHRRSDVHQVP